MYLTRTYEGHTFIRKIVQGQPIMALQPDGTWEPTGGIQVKDASQTIRLFKKIGWKVLNELP